MTKKYGDKLNEKLITSDKSKNVLKDYTKAYYIFDTIISEYTEGYDLPDLGVSDVELKNYNNISDSSNIPQGTVIINPMVETINEFSANVVEDTMGRKR